MKPNQYDNEEFFQEYAKMSRSKQGLDGAGEWYRFKQLLPSLEDKEILDLGCGYGWHSKYMVEQGARRVVGIDASRKMIEVARKHNSDAKIEYRIGRIEEYEYPKAQWDLVISNLVLHYISNLEKIYDLVYRTLKPGGVFVFNIEHPTFTAGVHQEWIYGEDGTALYWPVDDYFYPGERLTNFLGYEIRKHHHTLTQILMGLIGSGFEIQAIEEVQPSKEMMNIPGMEEEMRRPMMLLVRAKKEMGERRCGK